MPTALILASGSTIRRQMLENAGLDFTTHTARIDEEMLRAALLQEGATPRDIADALAEAKARKVSEKHPEVLVIGCDQVLDFGGRILSKPVSPQEAVAQLREMRGKKHSLFSAAVVYQDARPVWRHIGQVRLLMRPLGDSYVDTYVQRNWDSIKESVGAYKLEEEGVRLFSKIDGDYFTVLGLPLVELLSFLILRGELDQ